MKVVLPEKERFNKRQLAIYISIITICIISVIIAIYFQIYNKEELKIIGNENKSEIRSKRNELIEVLKSEFDQIFTNSIENGEGYANKKKESDKPLVYTKMQQKESKLNSYDIEVYIPYINIDNAKIDQYNKEIEAFTEKMNSILEEQKKDTIYTVEYVANVQSNILSLMIRSNLKEGTSAQRIIIQTYNYDLKNDKEITLENALKIKNLNKTQIQQQIKNEIEIEQKKVEDLGILGYSIYSRNMNSDLYKIENTKNFYLTNNNLYIIYAYGNHTFTSEMDLIVL